MSKLFLIAGPCVVENDKTPFEIGRKVKGICDELGIDYIFKASFKKANRTKLNSFTGIEKEEAMAIIQAVGKELGVPTITDVHESYEPAQPNMWITCKSRPSYVDKPICCWLPVKQAKA